MIDRNNIKIEVSSSTHYPIGVYKVSATGGLFKVELPQIAYINCEWGNLMNTTFIDSDSEFEYFEGKTVIELIYLSYVECKFYHLNYIVQVNFGNIFKNKKTSHTIYGKP